MVDKNGEKPLLESINGLHQQLWNVKTFKNAYNYPHLLLTKSTTTPSSLFPNNIYKDGNLQALSKSHKTISKILLSPKEWILTKRNSSTKAWPRPQILDTLPHGYWGFIELGLTPLNMFHVILRCSICWSPLLCGWTHFNSR